MEAVRYIVHGRVQGVGFRFFVQQRAQALQVRGWVRNRHDGSVEVLAIAPPSVHQDLQRELRKGPPASRVESVQIAPLEMSREEQKRFRGFSVEASA